MAVLVTESEETPPRHAPLSWTRILWWTLFGAAFGFVEAAVVIYIRRITDAAPGLDYQQVLTGRGVPYDSANIVADMKRHGIWRLEFCREAATILLLFGAAWAAGRTNRERWGIFGYGFAVWDLTYYLFLALWIGFPHSLTAQDIYFLIPIAWHGPTWFPVLIFMPTVIVLALRLLRLPPRT